MSLPLPCNSARMSGSRPRSGCRPSVFCVIRKRSLPSRWSSTRARCEALGPTRSGRTFQRGAGSPASRRVHTPSGPRKSGMPESVLMPAPVKATTCSEAMIQREISSICRSRLTLAPLAMAGGQVERRLVEHLRRHRAVFFRTPFVGVVAYPVAGADEDHAHRTQTYELHPVVRGAAREIVRLETESLARRPHRASHRLRTGNGSHPLQDICLETHATPLAQRWRAL